MIVALDTQLALGTATGIGEYARGLAGALRAQGMHTIELQEPRLDPWRFDRRVWWDQVVLPRRARASGAGLLHCTAGTMPLRAPLPLAVTVHDVAWLKVQQHTRFYARYYFGNFSLRRYRQARAVFVDSHFSKSELLGACDLHADRVHVVYPGVAADYRIPRPERVRERFVLVPGTVEPRKNLEVLVRALALLADLRIVSVGPFTPYRERCLALADALHVRDRLELRGYVSRADLLELYARCGVVAVPSRYEGFGYAAAQALCSGTPLLVSDCASLPEVAGGDAPSLDADDAHAWARAIASVLDDPQTAARRAAAAVERARERFAWDASARAAIAVYRAMLENG
ncbi:MAG: glycosyltransferase family 4 protein [Candidatus Baltobacteraceae bacterium]